MGSVSPNTPNIGISTNTTTTTTNNNNNIPNNLNSILNPTSSSQNLSSLNNIITPLSNTTTTTTTNTSTPPRKRSKVSRACDECRRKKIRCNAIFDINSNSILKICTNCDKNNDNCTFTRIPLKRGPSKGYNKRLSDDDILDNININNNDSPQIVIRRRSNSQKISKSNSINNNDTIDNINTNTNTNTNNNVTLPPLNSLSIPNQNQSPSQSQSQSPQQQSQSQQKLPQHDMFWKVPTSMPTFNPNLLSHDRKNSVDSTNSSYSNSSFNSYSNKNLLFNENNKSGSSFNGIENSDSDDDFTNNSNNLNNNNSRFSRVNYQIPTNLVNSNNSPRVSFDNDRERSSISSILSNNSSILPKINLPNRNNNKNIIINMNEINNLLDNYYNTLYQEYPLLPSIEIMKNSISKLIDNSDYNKILELLINSLNSFNIKTIILNNNLQKFEISIITQNIFKLFETITSLYNERSILIKSDECKIVFTSILTLLNYAIVLSGTDYSLGFGIAFSFFKDWGIFKENYESESFINLIQLVIIDNLHTLYFGVPRSSTIGLAIDSSFIEIILNKTKLKLNYSNNLEIEWISIGLYLITLNNDLQQLDSIEKLELIKITGTKYKFMSIIKLYYELFIYFKKLENEFQTITNNNSKTSNSSLDENLKIFIYNIEIDLLKIIKKITNLIDEQLDDLELCKSNVLIAIILIKCYRISKINEILIKSIINLNNILEPSLNNSINRSRSNSTNSSIDSTIWNNITNSINNLADSTFTNNLSNFNSRLLKLNENIDLNCKRCLNIKHIHNHCNELLMKLQLMNNIEIIIPRTNNNKKSIEYSIVIHNWIRLTNAYFTGEITREGINGWCYI